MNPSACVREKWVQGVWDQWGAGKRQRGQALQPWGHLGTRGFGTSEGRMEGKAKNRERWVRCCESLKWPAESPYLLCHQKHPGTFLTSLPSPTLSQLKVHSGETVHQREAEGSRSVGAILVQQSEATSPLHRLLQSASGRLQQPGNGAPRQEKTFLRRTNHAKKIIL